MADRDIQGGSGNGGCSFHDVAVAVVRFLSITVSVLVSVREEISFICQKMSFRMAFLESSTAATSMALSGSVVVLTA